MESKLLLFSFILVIQSCTWNASIKSLEESSGSTSSDKTGDSISECADNTATSTACKISYAGKYITSTLGSGVTSWSNATLGNTITATIPDGYYSGQMCSLQDTNLISNNIKIGTNIFGVTGNYIGSYQLNMASNALRDPGIQVIANLDGQTTSNQITLDNEVNTYAGAALPTTSGYNYRDIPDVNKDNDGYDGVTCKYASRPSQDCGGGQNTIATRIADCETQNPSSSTWNGATQCNGGEGSWKLVSRNGANKEVWQDLRTGLLWSSKVSTGANWCQASGNIQFSPVTYSTSYYNGPGNPITGNGTIGLISGGSSSSTELIVITFSNATDFSVSGTLCGGGSISAGGLTTTPGSTVTWSRTDYCSFTLTQGSVNFTMGDIFVLNSNAASMTSCVPGASSGLQPAAPFSYCAEAASVNPTAGENWIGGVYLPAKGGMGKTVTAQSPSVRWRLPSSKDYNIANANGIRFVMPDMGIAGTNRPIPDTSTGGASGVEWTTTLLTTSFNYAWTFSSSSGAAGDTSLRFQSRAVRCVGR